MSVANYLAVDTKQEKLQVPRPPTPYVIALDASAGNVERNIGLAGLEGLGGVDFTAQLDTGTNEVVLYIPIAPAKTTFKGKVLIQGANTGVARVSVVENASSTARVNNKLNYEGQSAYTTLQYTFSGDAYVVLDCFWDGEALVITESFKSGAGVATATNNVAP